MELNTEKVDWDFSPLFKNDNDSLMEKKRKECEEKLNSFLEKWRGRNDFLSEPEVLAEALAEYEAIMANYGFAGSEYFYFYLRSSQNQTDSEVKAKFNKVDEFEKKWSNELKFFTLSVSKISESEQEKFLEHSSLKDYKHFLERLFKEARYLLSEQEEKLITLKSSASHGNWVKMVSGLLSKEEREVLVDDGKKEKKNFSEIVSLLNSTNKKVRDSAAEAFNGILEKYSEVAEAEMNAVLGNKKVDDELRKMPRPDISRHLADDIESEVVDAMVNSVSKRFTIAQKYYQFKAKLLGLPKLAYHERNIPYGKIDKKFSYPDSVSLVYNVFSSLDGKFAEIFKKFVEEGRVDVFPKKGKKDGAFCAYGLKKDPTYILLNHDNKLHDVLTMAHESGHGINFELMKEQNALNYDCILSTAEVASTFMEDFVLQELEKESDSELKLALMMMKLNDDVSTIFRQVACYIFEQKLHAAFREKGYLSKEEIGKLFQEYMSGYMGEAVEQSSGSENWWVYWGHIRRFFYNYSYASGLLISKAMQKKVKKDKKFMEKVKEFLSAGTSDSPKNIFIKMGIDIGKKEFWDEGLDEVEILLNEAESLAKKLGKI